MKNFDWTTFSRKKPRRGQMFVKKERKTYDPDGVELYMRHYKHVIPLGLKIPKSLLY